MAGNLKNPLGGCARKLDAVVTAILLVLVSAFGVQSTAYAAITRVKPTMKVTTDGPYMPGGKITYEITQSLEQIANKAVTSFEFEDDLPEGIVNVNVKLLIDGQDPHGAEEAHYFINGRHVTCSIYQQAFDKYFKYGDSPTKVVFTLICDIGSKVDEGTLLTNVAYCTINDSRESTEPITANVGHEPEYTLSKTATQQSAKKGETVNYQVKVGNTGEGSGPQVQVTDTPAEGISINAQSVTVTGLEEGQYTIDRDSLSQEPAALKVSFPKLPASADVTIAYNATVTSDGEENERLVNNVKLQDVSQREKTASATVTLDKSTGTITISNEVAGNAADAAKDFTFVVKLTQDGEPVNETFGDVVFDERGETTFQLRSGQQKTIEGIPEGVEYEVFETDAESAGYSTSIETSDAVT